jgi:hypothetical protein
LEQKEVKNLLINHPAFAEGEGEIWEKICFYDFVEDTILNASRIVCCR